MNYFSSEAIVNNFISSTWKYTYTFSTVYLFTRILFNVFVAGITFDITTPNKFAIAMFFLLYNL
jgi:hypothetical protein